jgi:hypothetical protein
MLHAPPTTLRTQRRFVARQRFNMLGALVAVAALPFLLRAIILPQGAFYEASVNALIFNSLAVLIAFWTRLSIETYPGNRSTHVILPSIVVAHAVIVTVLLMTRLPYDRLALLAGFVAHILWGYGLYFAVQRYIRHRIAIVPFGDVERLNSIGNVDWHLMREPSLDDATGCDGLVADFTARDMPPEWEALLADAAVQGRMVYQVKQLSESLTGSVAIDHLVGEQLRQPGPGTRLFPFEIAGRLCARHRRTADCPYGGGGDRRGHQARQRRPRAVPAAPRRLRWRAVCDAQVPHHGPSRAQRRHR